MRKHFPAAAVYLFTSLGFLSIAALFAVIISGFFYSISKIGLGAAISSFTFEWIPEGGKYGILPMIAGTSLIALIAVLFAVPLSFGIVTSVWIYNNAFSAFLRGLLRFMSGIPTVVYAFCGIIVIIPIFRSVSGGSGYNIITVSAALCFLILPTMTLTADSALHSFINSPENPVLTADSLGIKREKSFIYMVMYAQKKLLFTGALLAFGRAAGDTLIVLMLSGNAPVMPGGLFSSVRTLSGHISLLTAAEITPQAEFTLFLSGFLLFILALFLNFIVRTLRGR
ncbi:MAG: ABC transporter permease subunit [Deferribacteraceae bacterium]|jgi:phosphate transport system permease protein|nr:ABC transporter permease subunit [Deferribacteraceae bacterium]